MGHVLLVFGTLVAVNLGIGYMVSDYLYEDEQPVQGVVEIEEVEPAVQSAPAAPANSNEQQPE